MSSVYVFPLFMSGTLTLLVCKFVGKVTFYSLSLNTTHLEANGDAEADQEDGDGQLVKYAKRAEDVAKYVLQEQLLGEHGQHSQHIQDVEDRDRRDQCRHESLQVVALPRKRKRAEA